MRGKHVRGKAFTHNMERKLCLWLNRQYGCHVDPDDRRSLVVRAAACADGAKCLRRPLFGCLLLFNDHACA